MVDPSAVRRIVIDAARLVKTGEIVVFGSASLAFWLENAPTSRDVDLWVTPSERGDAVEALMGELSWYHERHSSYVEVLGPETFAGPRTWRERALRLSLPEAPGVAVIVPHPHDVLISKLERLAPSDRDHIQRILSEAPIDRDRLEALAAESPYRTGDAPLASTEAFELHIAEILATLPD
ncbi:DUF6036 family nucleotidyltransferase [Sorangium sp. So ce861]|uniref:DUF6036 family nucleotidyltransferase n=1 Tax=Sorangium sp. So ce861 TaxID=3133323 RepID=UPI003F5EE522